MTYLGHYYAAKIRGACDLALFDKTGDETNQLSAVKQIQAALGYWKQYADTYTHQYIQPVLYNRTGLVDLPAQTESVRDDIQMAEQWEKGTIDEAAIKRSRTEAGFKN